MEINSSVWIRSRCLIKSNQWPPTVNSSGLQTVFFSTKFIPCETGQIPLGCLEQESWKTVCLWYFFLTHCIKWCWGLKGGSWILFLRGSWYLFSLLPIVFRDKIQVYLLFCNSYHFAIGAISCPVFPDVKPLTTTPLQVLASPCAFKLNISHLICPVT